MIQQGRLSSQFHKLPQLSGCPALWNYMHLDRALIYHFIGELISNLTINKDVQSVKAHVATVTLKYMQWIFQILCIILNTLTYITQTCKIEIYVYI